MAELTVAQFADRLGEVVPVVMKEFTRRIVSDLKDKVTLTQLLILEFLEKEEECKMRDLAVFMGVSTAATTGIVERLVKCGYIVRVFDPQDRRIIKIKLTARGLELIKQLNLQRRQMIMRVFGEVTVKDRHDYLRILNQIKEVLINDDSRR